MKNLQLCPKAKIRNKEFQDKNLKGEKDSLGDFIYSQSGEIKKYILIIIHLYAEYSMLNRMSEYLFRYIFVNIRGNMTVVLGLIFSGSYLQVKQIMRTTRIETSLDILF